MGRLVARASSRRLAVAILAAAALIAAVREERRTVLAQEPVFRARTDVVQLDVSVLDDGGQPVRGLTADDFTILENGTPQRITGFTEVELPAWSPGRADWVRVIAPDVATNRLDAQRVVVIVMDDYNTRWEPDDAQLARRIAALTVDRLGPGDLAAVVYTVNRRSGQEFTVDRSLLHAAIDRFIPSGLGPQPQSTMSASNPGRGMAMPSREVQRSRSGACFMTDCVGMALRNAGEILRQWPGARKTLVLVSPGRFGASPETLDGVEEGHRMRELFHAMQLANINVYQYDPRGLEVEASLTDFGTLAEVTGGRAFTNTNAPDEFVPQMFRENGSYYLIGFEPADPTRDGAFRRINVRVNRPGVEVRARAGYYAADERPTDLERPLSDVDRALSGGLPTGDVPLTLSVVPFGRRGDRPAVGVLARVDADEGLTTGGDLEVIAVAFDSRWREAGAATGRFVLPAAGAAASGPAEFGLRLDLGPGRYEVRTAVTSPTTGRTGSVYASVTVPDFADEDLSLSGVVMERAGSGAALPDALTDLLPIVPTTVRTFRVDDNVAAVLRIHQHGRRRPEPAHVEARIVDDADRVQFAEAATLVGEAFGDRKEVDYRVALPIDRLAEGEYLLTFEVATGDVTARRDVRFSMLGQPSE